MSRVLYLMFVDWRWMKQRPHILAEGLARDHPLLVLYPIFFESRKLVRNQSPVRHWPFLYIPGQSGSMLRTLDIALQRLMLNLVAWWFKPDVIWVSHPYLGQYLPETFWQKTVIYDCMDLFSAFNDQPDPMLEQAEIKLVQHSEAVLCSSQHLLERLKPLASANRFHLVRNGFQSAWLERSETIDQGELEPQGLQIAYIGAVAAWFDTASLRHVLEHLPEAKLHLIGLLEQRPDLPAAQVVTHGLIEHDHLFEFAQQFDVFVMPFVVNDLILGVDPIKLYEYLCLNKPVISVFYPEVARFEEFIYFYRSPQELLELLLQASKGQLMPKAKPERVKAFLKANTWTARLEQIRAIIGQVTNA
jgi:teichuronic acid biosynthesis glycosyltransferase TuaH